jgi:hypothetical protein
MRVYISNADPALQRDRQAGLPRPIEKLGAEVLTPRHCRWSRQEIKGQGDAPGASGEIPAGLCGRQG